MRSKLVEADPLSLRENVDLGGYRLGPTAGSLRHCRLGGILVINPVHNLRNLGARGSKSVRRVLGVFIAERNSAYDEPVLAQAQLLPPKRRVRGECSLCNRCYAKRSRGECEVGDVGAALDSPVRAKRLIRAHDRDVRGAEKAEILQPLLFSSPGVTSRDSHGTI